MSLHNPFPPHGDPDPVEVFIFFWLPVPLIGLPLLGVIAMGIWSGIMLLFGW